MGKRLVQPKSEDTVNVVKTVGTGSLMYTLKNGPHDDRQMLSRLAVS